MSTQKTADEKPRRSWWPFGGASRAEEEEESVEPGMTAPKGRATPGRRTTEPDEGNAVTRTFGPVREYFDGVVEEVEKVTWPTREEAIRLSAIVLVTTVLSSIALGIIAFAYSLLFQFGLNQPMIFLAFLVLVLVVGFVVYRRSNRSVSGY